MVFDEVISPQRHGMAGMEGDTLGSVITTITPEAREGRDWRAGEL